MELPKAKLLNIVFGQISYPYWVGWDCLDTIAGRIAGLEPDRILLVTDDTVLGLYGSRFLLLLREFAPVSVLSEPPGEAMKSGAMLIPHLERAVAAGATRRSVVVAFGGGVPGNLGGMVAALLFRGVRLFHVPTTLVAAMDSVLSAKQAINSSEGKNHFGVYLPPEMVCVDLALMATLPERELRSGYGETAKNCLAIRPLALPGLIAHLRRGPSFEPEALDWMLAESLAAKSTVMSQDPQERGRGIVLEYGHTVGHAIELADWRRRGAEGLSHGESVVLGMLAAARVAQEVSGPVDPDVAAHEEVAEVLGIAPVLPAGVTAEAVMALVARDNKRGYLPLGADEAAMVLLDRLGAPFGPAERPLVAVGIGHVARAVAGLVPHAPALAS